MHEAHATILEAIADAIPDVDAVVQGDRRVTWAQLDDRAARLAAALQERGVGRGTTVALYLLNCPEHLEVVHACSKLRAISANVNFRYTADELVDLLDNADAEVLVFHRSLAPHVAAARARLPRVHTFIEVVDDPTAAPVTDALDHEWLLAAHDPAPRIARDGDDTLLWYTGGTTGLPKGVIWHQGTLAEYEIGYSARLLDVPVPTTIPELTETVAALHASGDGIVSLVVTPLIHATAMNQAYCTLLFGGTLVLLPSGRVDGDTVCATIERERATILTLVGGTIVHRVARALDDANGRGTPYDISSLRRVHNSGAMVSALNKDAFHRHSRATFYDSLGASEATGFAASSTDAPGASATARFRLGPSARVITPEGADVTPGSDEPGLIAVARSSGIGYHKDPERTAATFRTIDGTLHAVPGDWVRLHEDGTVTFLGRGSGTINTGGEKVWPEEVEEALKEHPLVRDAAVVGLDDVEWGEIVAATVSLAELPDGTAAPTVDDLRAHVGTLLAAYKRPRRIVVVDEVRRTTVGKLDYPAARQALDGS